MDVVGMDSVDNDGVDEVGIFSILNHGNLIVLDRVAVPCKVGGGVVDSGGIHVKGTRALGGEYFYIVNTHRNIGVITHGFD